MENGTGGGTGISREHNDRRGIEEKQKEIEERIRYYMTR
jgi:hypothetical protein